MYLSQKIRIFPTEKQTKVLWDLSEKCRLIYNFALQERIENWKANKEKSKEERIYINYIDQQNKLLIIKNKYPEYKWVYSKVLQLTLKGLNSNYKSFFALWKKGDIRARSPKFKGKKYFNTLDYNQSGFKILKDSIRFSHKHPSKIDLIFKINHDIKPNTKIKQVDLSLDLKKRWFVSIVFEIIEKTYIDNGKIQAIDLGISNIVSGVNLDSKFIQIKNRRVDLYWKNKLADVQSKRDQCKKYSRKWKKYNYKLIYMKRKLSNQMKDFQHKISKQIVENTKANTIIIGNLNIKQMAKKKKFKSPVQNKRNKTLNHSLQNTGSMGRFVQFLTYKAKMMGKKIIKIDESYTTQFCYKCGLKKKRSLLERNIICNCGNEIDRDLNSAINIMKKYLYLKFHNNLLQKPSLEEEYFIQKYEVFTTTHSLFRTKSKNGLVEIKSV